MSVMTVVVDDVDDVVDLVGGGLDDVEEAKQRGSRMASSGTVVDVVVGRGDDDAEMVVGDSTTESIDGEHAAMMSDVCC